MAPSVSKYIAGAGAKIFVPELWQSKKKKLLSIPLCCLPFVSESSDHRHSEWLWFLKQPEMAMNLLGNAVSRSETDWVLKFIQTGWSDTAHQWSCPSNFENSTKSIHVQVNQTIGTTNVLTSDRGLSIDWWRRRDGAIKDYITHPTQHKRVNLPTPEANRLTKN